MSSSGDESAADGVVPNIEHTERVLNSKGLRTFLVIDHTANQRQGSKLSGIWLHGGERRRLDDKTMSKYWR